MTKKSSNRFVQSLNIFWEGIVIYCQNLDTFIKYMFFPVLGQIFGLGLIYLVNYFFVTHLTGWIQKYPVFDNIPLVFTLLLICSFPGFMIFCKAFYDLIIAYGSLNSMICVLRGGKMKNKKLDPKIHDDILKKRLFSFVMLLFLLTIISVIGLFPLFIVPFAFLIIYLALVFQVFMLEDKISPIGAIKRSIYLVKGNYLFVSFLLSLSAIITYYFIPSLFIWLFEKTNIMHYLVIPVKTYIDVLAIPAITSALENSVSTALSNGYNVAFSIKQYLDQMMIAKSIVSVIIMTAVTWFLLPLRCAWFTLAYKLFDSEKTEELRKNEAKREK